MSNSSFFARRVRRLVALVGVGVVTTGGAVLLPRRKATQR